MSDLSLVTITQLAQHTKPIGVPMLRTMKNKRLIPFVKLGHRTVLFNPEHVKAAIAKLETKEQGSKARQ
jgi:hypothetical protein